MSVPCLLALADVDECAETPLICGSASACTNQPGTFRCHCAAGFAHGEACAGGCPHVHRRKRVHVDETCFDSPSVCRRVTSCGSLPDRKSRLRRS